MAHKARWGKILNRKRFWAYGSILLFWMIIGLSIGWHLFRDWASSSENTLLHHIETSGILVVATRNGPTTFYKGPFGSIGFEHDLVEDFAKYLGVKVKWVFPKNQVDLLGLVEKHEVDIAAAGIVITPEREKLVRFGPIYRKIRIDLVYRQDQRPPANLNDLRGKPIIVPKGSIYARLLTRISRQNSNLKWQTINMVNEDEILAKIVTCRINYTLDKSDNLSVNRHYFPQLAAAFSIGKSQSVAWALPKTGDLNLSQAISDFFNQIKKNGELQRLENIYFNGVKPLDYASVVTFLKHVHNRLPRFENIMKQTARQTHLNWRLLAAQSYEESHWDPYARSPTNVRGLMMLTFGTAKAMGIHDIFNPEQSLHAGAQYLLKLRHELPVAIKEPDRTWFALAAYNLGLQHIFDAQLLAKKLGENPDQWRIIRTLLPLLSQRQWFTKLPHGYAPGWAAVEYVKNIRNYYDILLSLKHQKFNDFLNSGCT